MVKKFYSFLPLFYILFFSFYSKAVDVQARVSQNPIGMNQNFDFAIDVISTESVDIDPPRLPPLENFILQNSHTSSQVIQKYSSTSGVFREFQKSFHFTLSAPREGNWTIPSLEVIVDGQSYQTQSIDVEVSSQVSPSRPFNLRDPFKFFDFFEDDSLLFQGVKEGVDLKAVFRKKKIYLGEMFPVEWYIYKKRSLKFPVSIQGYSNIQPQNFWLHKVKDITDIEFDQVVQQRGEEYLRGLLTSYVFFPLKTGKLSIDSLEVKLNISDFSSFFSRENSTQIKSHSVHVEVLPLPTLGKGNFTGAVGEFKIRSQVSSKQIQQSDLLSYKISFEGKGGVSGIKLPLWNQENDFEIYNTLESQEFSPRKSSKTFEVLLIPKRAGTLQIPSFKWTTFDPNLESYVEHEIPSHTIQVQKSSLSEKQTGESFLGEMRNDSESSFDQNSILKFIYKYFWFIFTFVFFSLSGFLGMRYRYIWFKKPQKNLGKLLLKGCTKARHLKNKKLYSEVGVLLLKIIDQIWLSLTGTMGRDMETLLSKCPPSVRLEMGQKFQSLVERLEFLSFAPKEAHEWTEKEVEKIIQETEMIVSRFLKHYR